MKLTNGRITILINPEYTTIELIDSDSATTFARVTLTPDQLSEVLSRRSNVECEIEVRGLEKLGKKQENTTHIFEYDSELLNAIPYGNREERDNYLYQVAQESVPEGWSPDKSFNSQNTFSVKDNKHYCRVIIRRWI